MAFWGMMPSDYDDYSANVFPQNIQSVNLFDYLCTQWFVGPGGPYGLNYQSLYAKLDRMKNLTDAERDQLEDDMRIMEQAALDQMRKDKPD